MSKWKHDIKGSVSLRYQHREQSQRRADTKKIQCHVLSKLTAIQLNLQCMHKKITVHTSSSCVVDFLCVIFDHCNWLTLMSCCTATLIVLVFFRIRLVLLELFYQSLACQAFGNKLVQLRLLGLPFGSIFINDSY